PSGTYNLRQGPLLRHVLRSDSGGELPGLGMDHGPEGLVALCVAVGVPGLRRVGAGLAVGGLVALPRYYRPLDVRLRRPAQGLPGRTGLVLPRDAAVDSVPVGTARRRRPVGFVRERTAAAPKSGPVAVVLGAAAGRLLLPLEGKASPLFAALHDAVGGPGGAGDRSPVAGRAGRPALAAASRAGPCSTRTARG